MKKQILNLGKALNKVEQKTISGGVAPVCTYPETPCYCPIYLIWSCSVGDNCV